MYSKLKITRITTRTTDIGNRKYKIIDFWPVEKLVSLKRLKLDDNGKRMFDENGHALFNDVDVIVGPYETIYLTRIVWENEVLFYASVGDMVVGLIRTQPVVPFFMIMDGRATKVDTYSTVIFQDEDVEAVFLEVRRAIKEGYLSISLLDHMPS